MNSFSSSVSFVFLRYYPPEKQGLRLLVYSLNGYSSALRYYPPEKQQGLRRWARVA